LVESLIDLFPEGVLKVERPGWPLPPQAERVCDPGELWLNLVVNHPTNVVPEIFKKLSRRPLEEAEGLWFSLVARRKNLDAYMGRLAPEFILAWLNNCNQYQGRPNINVRNLTNFSDCPRKFWYQELLGLYLWPGPLETWPNSAQGEVIHQTLERFLAPMVKRETKDYGPSRLKYIYWEVVHRHYCYRPVGRKPIFDALALKLEAALMAWIARHKELSKTEIAAIEWSFGPNQGNNAPPYKVESPSGHFYMTGRVDRVDWDGGHVVVRDYKTNRSSIYAQGGGKPKEGPRPYWHYPMLLYSLVAGELFKAEAEAIIEFVDPREGKDQLKIAQGDSSELSELWEALLRGELTLPIDPKQCDYCQFFRLCRPHSRIHATGDETED
jgi:CRISPR/Cas system-associated exonuclease Cas4 (RecB family)